MHALLDTHVLLWMGAQPDRLSEAAARLIGRRDAILFISPASLWELAIKLGNGRLTLTGGVEPFARRLLALERTRWLPISPAHLGRVTELPQHHRDPFDRLLIAQALVEGVPMVSRDSAFARYQGLTTIW